MLGEWVLIGRKEPVILPMLCDIPQAEGKASGISQVEKGKPHLPRESAILH